MRNDELFESSGQKKVEKLEKAQAEKEQANKSLAQKLLENEQKEQADDIEKIELMSLLMEEDPQEKARTEKLEKERAEMLERHRAHQLEEERAKKEHEERREGQLETPGFVEKWMQRIHMLSEEQVDGMIV